MAAVPKIALERSEKAWLLTVGTVKVSLHDDERLTIEVQPSKR